MKFVSKNVLLVVLVAFFLFVIGYNVLGNAMGNMEGFKEGASDNSKFTAQNITDIIKCADPDGNKSPYSGSDILSMLGGSSYSMSNGKVTCSKSGDSKSGDSKGSDSKSGDSKSGDSKSGDSKSGDSKSGDSNK